MQRSDPDLFDFFGRGSKSSKGPRAVASTRATHRSGHGSTHSGTSHAEAGYDDRVGARRRRLLVGATATLLVVLAFVAGIAVGRGKKVGDGFALAGGQGRREEVVETWILKGRPLARLAPVGQADIEKSLLDEMKVRHKELAPYLATAPVEEGRGRFAKGTFRLVARGFQSEASALAWAKVLSRERVGEYQPFQDCRPERATR